jgi:hypothetical protein
MTTPGSVLPNYRTPRLVGILNIVFAANILAYVLVMAVVAAFMPLTGRAVTEIQKKIEAQGKRSRKAEMDVALQKLKAAKTEQEKIQAEARRLEIESRPKAIMPGMVDFNKFVYSDPIVISWFWTELVSSLILNVVMLVAGVGLFYYRSWGRTAGIWNAALKIVRLVLIYGIAVIAIVPLLSRNLATMAAEMIVAQQQALGKAGGPAQPAEFLAKVYMVMYSIMAVGMMVAGSIYPAVSIWFLTRPSTRAACLVRLEPKPKPTLELPEP